MDDYGWGGDHYRAFRRLRQAVRRLAEGSGKTSERLHDVTSLALGWPRARGTLPGAALGRIGMSIDWRSISEKATIAVITAVVLGGLTLLWNWGSNGGIVRALGGVTKDDVADIVNKLGIKGPPGERGPPGPPGPFQPGAVVAFDLPTGCPAGWSIFERGMSRTIIGASGTGLSVFDVPNLDANEHRLRAHAYQSTGGEEKHTLKVDELPTHDHGIKVLDHSEYVREKGYHGTDDIGRDLSRADPNWGVVRYTEAVGGSNAFNTMPPFIALFLCKTKD
jgi:hypothetical protein